MTPSEVMNRVKLLFPNATMEKDSEGQIVINTGMLTVGEGIKERFVPVGTELPVEDVENVENVEDDGKDKDKDKGKPPKP